MSTSNKKPDDLMKTVCEYSEIQPQDSLSRPVPPPVETCVKSDTTVPEPLAIAGNAWRGVISPHVNSACP